MNLTFQRRMASEIFKVGKYAVWLDPEEAGAIKRARSREKIRELIGKGFIQNRFDWQRNKQKRPENPKFISKYRQLQKYHWKDFKRLLRKRHKTLFEQRKQENDARKNAHLLPRGDQSAQVEITFEESTTTTISA
eukprot:TRINITY_DN28964_c0_g1_i1.p1 TRINITY_DN28964_c0_g1~~TRINITY_DN28964_c0_g1_i1.p1  ORF type:complete len:147 (+),score=1.11 TRINITY_DN28964_c0_g1_i1:39-443(+)